MADKKKNAAAETDAGLASPATDAAAKPFSGEINPSTGKTIDERMDDLLKDHQAMGARPTE